MEGVAAATSVEEGARAGAEPEEERERRPPVARPAAAPDVRGSARAVASEAWEPEGRVGAAAASDQAGTQSGGAGGGGGGTAGVAGATGGPCSTNFSGGAGGGGSGYIGGVTGGATSSAVHAGNGQVTITW